ncbi:hypothetical protein [Algicella marina]|uniref:2-keto-4-pentenoate hydratase n=1 Tax=Algicella marina TaxID=2683284 RepID=A0A6P1SUM1_9RHOB|nr:hypothetical protein [Algicella marina]QHQ34384.1 hypothetical protein GO499_03880 [Algicella marina]
MALVRARSNGILADTAALPPVVSTTMAYDIQARVVAAAGPIGGYKTGRASPGEPLIAAPIFAKEIRDSDAIIPFEGSRLRGFELEVGFRVDTPLPRTGGTDIAEKLALTVTPVAVIEIVESRLVDPLGCGALWKLADNQINGGLVVGASGKVGTELWADLRLDDATLVSGGVTNPAGRPWEVLQEFLTLAESLSLDLSVGQLVITGSLTGLRYAEAGQKLVGEIAGLGRVCCHFEAE